jgi:CheY-like chemotaxis protein
MIRVESTVGEGTAFLANLPLVDPPTKRKIERPTAPGRGHERILVVDDDLPVRRIIEQGLSARGYVIEGASSATDAIARLRNATIRPSLIVTDHRMVDSSGIDLAHQVRRQFQIPVILCTGWADEQIHADAREARVVAVLDKPIRAAEMARVVRDVLDGNGSTDHRVSDSASREAMNGDRGL